MYILVVEDERRLAQVVRRVLEEEGHTVDVAYDGEEGLAMATDGSHDVLVLDILLPAMDGFEVCRTLRRNRVDTPILLLTALDSIDDRVRGLDACADDDLRLDLRRRRAERDGRTIELSPREFSLLEFLMRNEGRVVTRMQMLDHIWGYDYATDSNLVDVYMAYLRRKVDRGNDRKLIRTVRGVGYALGD